MPFSERVLAPFVAEKEGIAVKCGNKKPDQRFANRVGGGLSPGPHRFSRISNAPASWLKSAQA